MLTNNQRHRIVELFGDILSDHESHADAKWVAELKELRAALAPRGDYVRVTPTQRTALRIVRGGMIDFKRTRPSIRVDPLCGAELAALRRFLKDIEP